MIYHRPLTVLLKHRERIWFRHQEADLEENRAETLLWLCLPTPVCTHVYAHTCMHIYFCMNSILYLTFIEKDEAGSIFKATACDQEL